jgi:hypothetical protein
LARALANGHRQTGVRGDAWQQGGAGVIGTDGVIRYVYRSKVPGDHPSLADVLEAIPSA